MVIYHTIILYRVFHYVIMDIEDRVMEEKYEIRMADGRRSSGYASVKYSHDI